MHQNCGQILRYAVATGRADRDPSGDLRGALPPAKQMRIASITEPKEVAELLRALDAFRGTLVVKAALRLAPLVFVRPGELRKAQWDEMKENAQRATTSARGGARLLAAELIEVENTKDGGVEAKIRVTVEIEGGERPACVVDTISRYYLE